MKYIATENEKESICFLESSTPVDGLYCDFRNGIGIF